ESLRDLGLLRGSGVHLHRVRIGSRSGVLRDGRSVEDVRQQFLRIALPVRTPPRPYARRRAHLDDRHSLPLLLSGEVGAVLLEQRRGTVPPEHLPPRDAELFGLPVAGVQDLLRYVLRDPEPHATAPPAGWLTVYAESVTVPPSIRSPSTRPSRISVSSEPGASAALPSRTCVPSELRIRKWPGSP